MILRALLAATFGILPAWFSSAASPEPKADVVVTAPGVPVSFQPLVNDTDPDGDALTIASFSQTNNATVEEVSPGVLRYTPKDGFFGHDEVSYTVSDGSASAASVAHLFVTTTGKSWPLAASSLYLTRPLGSSVPQDITFPSVDLEGKLLAIESYSQPTSGRLELIRKNVVRYYPEPGGTRPWTFTYRQSNGESLSNTATIQIEGPNGTGTYTYAMRDEAVTRPGRSVDVKVLSNDLGATAISTFGQPAHGSVTQPVLGVLRYTPDSGFEGSDEFMYSASGVGSIVPTATVAIVVTSRETPEVVNDSITVEKGGSSEVRVLDNDHELVGGALSIAGFSQPQHGTVTEVAPGRLQYTAAADFVGTDTFIYQATNGKGVASGTVTVSVLGRRAPYARDDTRETASGTTIAIPVLSNDAAFNGAVLVPRISSLPENGIAIFENGVVTYTPDRTFAGIETFVYSVSDGELTSFAMVRINVKANLPPVVYERAITAISGQAIKLPPIDQEYDPEGVPLTVKKLSNPAHGFVNWGQTLEYVPYSYVGEDSFSYEVFDGVKSVPVTVRITVLPSAAPIAVDDRLYVPPGTTTPTPIRWYFNDYDPEDGSFRLANWTPAQHGTVEVIEGVLSYTPGPDYAGFDQFKYTIIDDGAGGTSEATVTVGSETNAPPIPVDDLATIPAGTDRVRIPVLANDTDPDGDSLTISGYNFTNWSDASVDRAGTDLVYIRKSNTSAVTDTFTYAITDGRGNTRSATVTVDVSKAAILPVGEVVLYPDFAVLPAGATSLRIFVEENDWGRSDTTITSVTNGTQGTATASPAVQYGSQYIDYVPNFGFSGEDRFTYTATDNVGHTQTTFVRVVAGPKRPPVANSDSSQLPAAATSTAVSVLENDSDPGGEPLRVVAVTNGSHGVATIDGGNVIYTRTSATFTDDAFTYTVANQAGLESTGIVRIVSNNNRLPVAAADQVTVTSTSQVAINVLSNDADPDGDLLTVSSVSNASRGTTSTDGALVYYQPTNTPLGPDSFTYTMSDGHGGFATGTVTVRVAVVVVASVHAAVPGAGENGSNVPGDAVFRSFGSPSINDAESVAFSATYRAGGKIHRGVFAGNPLRPIAQDGEGVPDRTGSRVGTEEFLTFEDPLLNSHGDVVFLADIRSSSGARRSGIWFQPHEGALREITLEKDQSQSISEARIDKVLSVALLDSGAVYFKATSKIANNGGKSSSLWRYYTGSLKLVLRQGSEFEGMPGKVVREFQALPAMAGSPGQGRITETGIPVHVTWRDGSSAILLVDGETPQIIAQSGGAAPDGGIFTRLGFPDINNPEDTAFLAKIKNQDGSTGTKIFAESAGLGLASVAAAGDPVPFMSGTFVNFDNPVITAQRNVAFIATTEMGRRRARNRGIWWTGGPDRPGLAFAIGESSYLPGGSGEWLMKSLISLALPDGAAGPLFTARVKGNNGRVETGLWACESTGAVQKIIRTGESVAGYTSKLLRSFDALKLVPRSPSQPRSYNSHQRLVYRATFADGEQAILKASLP